MLVCPVGFVTAGHTVHKNLACPRHKCPDKFDTPGHGVQEPDLLLEPLLHPRGWSPPHA